jgi:hypothetical protein
MPVDVNGQSFESWDHVPDPVKQQLIASGYFNDADGNGVPDILEGKLPPGLPTTDAPGAPPGSPTVVTSTSTSFSVNGQGYSSFDQLPAEVQAALRSSLGGQAPTATGGFGGPAAMPPGSPTGLGAAIGSASPATLNVVKWVTLALIAVVVVLFAIAMLYLEFI